jgi:phosphatidylglycerophosphate synthase
MNRRRVAAGHAALGLLPHLLTGSRLLSAPLIVYWIGAGATRFAAAGLLAAMLTDFLDGPLIRRFGTPSRAGAYFDVWADFAVIAAAFGGLASAGMVAAWPLFPIGLSFALFLATAGKRPTIYDPVGRSIGGILMASSLVLLTVEDFLVQEAVLWTSSVACGITMVGRVAYLLPPRGSPQAYRSY